MHTLHTCDQAVFKVDEAAFLAWLEGEGYSKVSMQARNPGLGGQADALVCRPGSITSRPPVQNPTSDSCSERLKT